MLSSTKSRKVGNKSLQIFLFFFLVTQICFAQWYNQSNRSVLGKSEINDITTNGGVFLSQSDNGLIAYYPFNGNTDDESGYGQNGSLASGALLTSDRFGITSSAYELNGVYQYISLPTSLSITADLTISFWIRTTMSDPNTWSSGTFIIDRDVCGGARDWSIDLGQGGKIEFETGTASSDNVLSSKKEVKNGSWRHVVVVRDSANLKKKIYIDGIVDVTATFDNQQFENNNQNIYIGASVCETNYHTFYNGNIDDIRFYNRVLTDSEVLSLYNEVPPPIQVRKPNRKKNIYIGTSYKISWSAYGLDNVNIEYSTDAGSSWSSVTTSTPAATGTYSWTVPNTPTTEGLVRLSDAGNASIFDVSDSVFTVLLPPVISVIVDSLSEDLYSGKTAAHSLTIQNNGASDLQFSIEIVEELQTNLISKASAGSGLKILLITSAEQPPNETKNALQNFSDIQAVDVFDARYSTPTLNELMPYHSVIIMNDYSFNDPVKLGNILADYVDAGRGLVMTSRTFCSGWWSSTEVQGRLLSEDYFPFNVGYLSGVSASLGTFNQSHPIMRGVTSATGSSLAEITLADDAELVALWNNAMPFIATQDKNVVAVNISVAISGGWTGDIPLILRNAAFWAGRGGWLNVEPNSGIVSAGSSIKITLTFDAAGLIGDEYDAEVIISSNDPITPKFIIPAHLMVTDAPAFSVNKDSIDFGEVFLGVTDTIYLEVRNIGSQDLLVFGTSIQPTVYNVHPKFAGIDVGDNETFTITFLPLSVGTYAGTVTFNSNDPTFNIYTIQINGVGIEPPIININPDSLVISILPGAQKTHMLTIHNQGPSNLYFDIYGGFNSSNYALQFDGVNDYVKIVDVDLIYSQLTLEAWTYLDIISPIHEVIDNIDGDFQLEIWEDGSIMFDAVGGGTRLVSNSNTMPLNQWVHLACTYDGGISSIFVNGNLVTTGNFSGSVNRPNTVIHIGTETNSSDQFWDGGIDEVRIWSIARTKAEIEECKSQQLTGIEPNLVGYWQFDEGAGNNVKDKTINANHGILQGGVTWINSSAPMEPGWFTISTDSGICSANSSIDIELLFNATELDMGDYFATLIIKNNDPTKPSVTIPVHMIVSTTVGIEDEFPLPTVYSLYQNFPNPFNPSTTIKYSIPNEGRVSLIVFNLLGEEVTTLVNEEQTSGNYKVEFNISSLPSGVYFYQLKAGTFVSTRKMLLLR